MEAGRFEFLRSTPVLLARDSILDRPCTEIVRAERERSRQSTDEGPSGCSTHRFADRQTEVTLLCQGENSVAYSVSRRLPDAAATQPYCDSLYEALSAELGPPMLDRTDLGRSLSHRFSASVTSIWGLASSGVALSCTTWASGDRAWTVTISRDRRLGGGSPDLSGPVGRELEPIVLERHATRTLGLLARP